MDRLYRPSSDLSARSPGCFSSPPHPPLHGFAFHPDLPSISAAPHWPRPASAYKTCTAPAAPGRSPTSSSAMSDNPTSRPESPSAGSSSKRPRRAYEPAEPGSFSWPRQVDQPRHSLPYHQQQQQPGAHLLLPPLHAAEHGGGMMQTPTVASSSSAAAGPSSSAGPSRTFSHGERGYASGGSVSAPLLQSPVSGDAPQMHCRLRIRQQPEVARACGFGERDRRVVDPPPVVELEIEPQVGQLSGDVEELNLSQYVVHATLFSEDGTEDVGTFLQQPRTAARRLVGSLAATPAVAADEFGHRGAYFAFADLSCREPGSYRMRFTLVEISAQSAQVLANVLSDVFRVYTPKDFPGMRRSTPLTNALKIQGVSIPAKKGRHITMSK